MFSVLSCKFSSFWVASVWRLLCCVIAASIRIKRSELLMVVHKWRYTARGRIHIIVMLCDVGVGWKQRSFNIKKVLLLIGLWVKGTVMSHLRHNVTDENKLFSYCVQSVCWFPKIIVAVSGLPLCTINNHFTAQSQDEWNISEHFWSVTFTQIFALLSEVNFDNALAMM